MSKITYTDGDEGVELIVKQQSKAVKDRWFQRLRCGHLFRF